MIYLLFDRFIYVSFLYFFFGFLCVFFSESLWTIQCVECCGIISNVPKKAISRFSYDIKDDLIFERRG